MIIGSSAIKMESSRSFAYQAKQSTVIEIDSAKQTTEAVKVREDKDNFRNVLKSESDEEATSKMEETMLGMKNRYGGVSTVNKISSAQNLSSLERIREQSLFYLLRRLHEIFYGRTGSTTESGSFGGYTSEGTQSKIGTMTEMYSYEETETTEFSTTGTVVTKDGREINFNLELSMSRSFSEFYKAQHDINMITSSDSLVDPLVINLDQDIADVTDQKFRFDLDSDGILDNISGLGSKSGFLALDKNSDGTINDGNELFGTKSGDGFGDLAKYDEDHNGWIDEADPVFEKLLIWSKDENGKDQLYHLKEKGVGAIGLESVSTDFTKNSMKDNKTNAVIRQTGIFLYENGMAGTVQHLDLAK